jgi:hypothetical protein
MDYSLMVPLAGADDLAFDRMARAAAEMGERWRKLFSNLLQRIPVFPASEHVPSKHY